MTIQATNSARLQLQSVVRALTWRSAVQAAQFVREMAAVLANRAAIEKTATPIAGFPELPTSEIVLHGYRLFFRTANGTLWLTGVWRTSDVGYPCPPGD
ncbi:hypothetical protein ACFLS0_01985 [Candidatus Bipolaricaulota bacterium]